MVRINPTVIGAIAAFAVFVAMVGKIKKHASCGLRAFCYQDMVRPPSKGYLFFGGAWARFQAGLTRAKWCGSLR